MQISTNQFLLGSLGALLAQESSVGQLDQEIASGQTLTDATSDPTAAGEALALGGNLDRLSYDSANAAAASDQIQTGLGVLQQVGTLIDQLQQTALQGADTSTAPTTRTALVSTAQNGLQQLLQLANSQDADGRYIFAGSNSGAAPFATLANGTVAFNGDGGTNTIEVAPSLTVPVTVSGQKLFTAIPAGEYGVGVAAASGNTGTAYAEVQGVTSAGAVATERAAGTQYQVAFSAGPAGTLNYTIASGAGNPGSRSFSASSGTVASGRFSAGQDLQFGGIELAVTGTPAAGDEFTVQPAATSSLFGIVQGLITALQSGGSNSQGIENAIANLNGAQSTILSAQAGLSANLAEVEGIQNQDSTTSTNDQTQLASLQSANLPQVLANYSEGVTALQAAEVAFAKIQNLSLFSVIQ
jgi:flagellar hook-associated protein 3 FlgL